MTDFINAGLPKNISEAYRVSSRERKIGEAKCYLISGLQSHQIQFDPSTISIGLWEGEWGEQRVTAHVKIPVTSDFCLGVEYYGGEKGRFGVWIEDKDGEICGRGKYKDWVSYNEESLSYCLAMCFAWLSLEVLNKQEK